MTTVVANPVDIRRKLIAAAAEKDRNRRAALLQSVADNYAGLFDAYARSLVLIERMEDDAKKKEDAYATLLQVGQIYAESGIKSVATDPDVPLSLGDVE